MDVCLAFYAIIKSLYQIIIKSVLLYDSKYSIAKYQHIQNMSLLKKYVTIDLRPYKKREKTIRNKSISKKIGITLTKNKIQGM